MTTDSLGSGQMFCGQREPLITEQKNPFSNQQKDFRKLKSFADSQVVE